MKIIFSRKGFDQEFGGSPSPFISKAKPQSLPIPSQSGIPYSEILCEKDKCLKTLMDELNIKSNKGNLAHLDPDVDFKALKRRPGWRGAFGQVGAAQGHLLNKGVGPGDLFLFFGWFRNAKKVKNRIQYADKSNLHVMYGYLMVDRVLALGENTPIPKWLEYHPHCEQRLRREKNNCVYIAKKEIAPGIPGYGVFKHSKETILTKTGETRSRWNLDKSIFGSLDISYHSEKSWKENYFQSAAKGQEFVVQADKKARRWALNLVKKHAIR